MSGILRGVIRAARWALVGLMLLSSLGAAAWARGASVIAVAETGLSFPQGTRVEPFPDWQWMGARLRGAWLHVPLSPEHVLAHLAAHSHHALRVWLQGSALIVAPTVGDASWSLRLRQDAAGTQGVLTLLHGAAQARPGRYVPTWLPPDAKVMLHLSDGQGTEQSIYQSQGWSAAGLTVHAHAALVRLGWRAVPEALGDMSRWLGPSGDELAFMVIPSPVGIQVFVHVQSKA